MLQVSDSRVVEMEKGISGFRPMAGFLDMIGECLPFSHALTGWVTIGCIQYNRIGVGTSGLGRRKAFQDIMGRALRPLTVWQEMRCGQSSMSRAPAVAEIGRESEASPAPTLWFGTLEHRGGNKQPLRRQEAAFVGLPQRLSHRCC